MFQHVTWMFTKDVKSMFPGFVEWITQRDEGESTSRSVPLATSSQCLVSLCLRNLAGNLQSHCSYNIVFLHWKQWLTVCHSFTLETGSSWRANLAWAASQHTGTSKSTKATSKCYALHSNCIVMWGLSSAIISSLHNSIHHPEMEMNPPEMACGCPHDIVIIKNGHTHNPLTQWNVFVSVQLRIYIYILGEYSARECYNIVKRPSCCPESTTLSSHKCAYSLSDSRHLLCWTSTGVLVVWKSLCFCVSEHFWQNCFYWHKTC